jgi:hypothetical protein
VQALGGGGDGVGVLVEPDERQVGMSVEQRLSVTAAAHGGVDHDPRRDGREQLDHQVHQDGTVGEPAALGCRPTHRDPRSTALAGMSPRDGLDGMRAEKGPSTAPDGDRSARGAAPWESST